ncbi:MAG: hypothetical protein ACK58L_12250 [Planctomycetota bacterium]
MTILPYAVDGIHGCFQQFQPLKVAFSQGNRIGILSSLQDHHSGPELLRGWCLLNQEWLRNGFC